MKNGLYSVHIQMGDGVRGRASGVIILRDGIILGGDPYFWSKGSYTFKQGTWKGALVTNQHLRTVTIVGMPNLGMPDWRGHATPLSDADVTDVVAWLAMHRTPLSASLNH